MAEPRPSFFLVGVSGPAVHSPRPARVASSPRHSWVPPGHHRGATRAPLGHHQGTAGAPPGHRQGIVWALSGPHLTNTCRESTRICPERPTSTKVARISTKFYRHRPNPTLRRAWDRPNFGILARFRPKLARQRPISTKLGAEAIDFDQIWPDFGLIRATVGGLATTEVCRIYLCGVAIRAQKGLGTSISSRRGAWCKIPGCIAGFATLDSLSLSLFQFPLCFRCKASGCVQNCLSLVIAAAGRDTDAGC